MPLSDKQLEILHDHYKETFERIREVEQTRDRLFLWVIGLFALLCLEIGFPASVSKSLGKLSIAGGEIDLQALPFGPLLNVTWALALVITLQYCRKAVWVNRQYPYLHYLERRLSPELGGGDLYQREGKVYLSDYPPMLELAWFAYSFLFPLIVMVAALGLAIWEYNRLQYHPLHILFDICMAATLIVFLFLYRVQPYLAAQRDKLTKKPSSEEESPETVTTPGQEQPTQEVTK